MMVNAMLTTSSPHAILVPSPVNFILMVFGVAIPSAVFLLIKHCKQYNTRARKLVCTPMMLLRQLLFIIVKVVFKDFVNLLISLKVGKLESS